MNVEKAKNSKKGIQEVTDKKNDSLKWAEPVTADGWGTHEKGERN